MRSFRDREAGRRQTVPDTLQKKRDGFEIGFGSRFTRPSAALDGSLPPGARLGTTSRFAIRTDTLTGLDGRRP